MDSSPQFQSLLQRAQAGDQRAMEQILAVLGPQLEAQARGYLDAAAPDLSASDLVQEAVVRAWQGLAEFQGGASDEETRKMLRGWIGQILHRVALNARRDREALKRRPENAAVVPLARGGDSGHTLDPAGSGPTPSGIAQVDERMRLIQSALEKIPDAADRAIFRLRFFEGLSLRQIAERTEASYDRVRDRYQACIRFLERELEGLAG